MQYPQRDKIVYYLLLLMSALKIYMPITPGKYFFGVTLVATLYIAFVARKRVSNNYYYILGWITFLVTMQLVTSELHINKDLVIRYLLWIMPFISIRLTSFRTRLKWKTQVILLSIVYLVTVIAGVTNSPTHSLAGTIFHSSFLALLGTIIALELLRHRVGGIKYILAMIFMSMPLLGSLRQYIYVVVPIVAYLLFERMGLKIVLTVVIAYIIVVNSPLGGRISSLREDTSAKGATFAEYYSSASNVEDATFEIRLQWWTSAIQRTVRENIIFGHSLNYQFTPTNSYEEGANSSLLHSYFVSSFADGGIVMFILSIMIFSKNIIKAIKYKDYYTLLILYAFVIFLGMNTLALSLNHSFIVFCAFGYYENLYR
jgi:hypothetical protein